MWSSNRRGALRLLSLGGLATLAACGFTPSYGPQGGASLLQGRLRVDDPLDRDAYLMTQQIESKLGRGAVADYGLSIAITTGETRKAVRADNITLRFNITGKATYALRDLATGAVVNTGTVQNFTGYSATSTTVATMAASRDARERLMVILADMITAKLIAAAPSFAAPRSQ